MKECLHAGTKNPLHGIDSILYICFRFDRFGISAFGSINSDGSMANLFG